MSVLFGRNKKAKGSSKRGSIGFGFDKRKSGFLSTDLPLTSERVKVILSYPLDSANLAQAVRASRVGCQRPFSLSSNATKRLKKLGRTN
jgi:hypothetical protein